jgi:hypothetical protein
VIDDWQASVTLIISTDYVIGEMTQPIPQPRQLAEQ